MSTFHVNCTAVVEHVSCVDTCCILLVRTTWYRVTEKKEPRNPLDIEKRNGRVGFKFQIAIEPNDREESVVNQHN